MFRTKRQQRHERLLKLSQRQWETLPEFLIATHARFLGRREAGGTLEMMQGAELASEAQDPEFRDANRQIWLDKSEQDGSFACRLDRYLELRTDDEDREYHEFWATRRNKAYYLFAVLAFIISLISLWLSLGR